MILIFGGLIIVRECYGFRSLDTIIIISEVLQLT